MGVFDDAKDKAREFAGQAKDKLGEQHGDQDRGQGGISGDLRDKASDAVQDAKDRFGG